MDTLIARTRERFSKAVASLEKAVALGALPENAERDAVLLRFELAAELMPKTLQRIYSLSLNSLAQKWLFSPHARASAKILLTVPTGTPCRIFASSTSSGTKSTSFLLARELSESPYVSAGLTSYCRKMWYAPREQRISQTRKWPRHYLPSWMTGTGWFMITARSLQMNYMSA